MKLQKNIYVVIIGLAAVAIGGWLVFDGSSRQPENGQAGMSTVLESKTAENQAALAIDYGDRETEGFQVNFSEGATAFDILKSKAEEMGLNFKTKAYDFGILIEAIGEKENGQGGKYWLYYVNGEMPMVSADKMPIKQGDKVEFKFEKSSF